MADREAAPKFAKDVFAKNIGDQTQAGVPVNDGAIGGGDAGGFLAAMLQGEKAVIAAFDGVGGAGDAEKCRHFSFFSPLISEMISRGISAHFLAPAGQLARLTPDETYWLTPPASAHRPRRPSSKTP